MREMSKVLHLERYSTVFLRVLMYREVNNINVSITVFSKLASFFYLNTKNCYLKKNPHGTAVGIIKVVNCLIELG